MKLTLSLLVFLMSSVSVASSLNYKCFSVDDNEPYALERIEVSVVSDDELKIELDVLKLVVESYKLNPSYASRAASMKNYLQFNVTKPDYGAYGEGPVTPFYVEKELLTGGYSLRRGGKGAFIKTAGHGYSWAKYLCVLQ